MAEFCLDCWNRIVGTKDPPGKYIISREPDLCEECGQWKPVIVRVKWRYIAVEWFCERIDCIAERMKE